MKPIWTRIKKWYNKNVPEWACTFTDGVSEQDLDAAETEFGVSLPKEVKETYRLLNGLQTGPEDAYYLMPLSEVLMEWKMMRDGVMKGNFAGMASNPDGPIRTDWWNIHWIPLASDGGGDFYCLDLDPPKEGTPGQIIEFGHEFGAIRVVAPSFRAWISRFADDLKAGRVWFDEEQGGIRREGEEE